MLAKIGLCAHDMCICLSLPVCIFIFIYEDFHRNLLEEKQTIHYCISIWPKTYFLKEVLPLDTRHNFETNTEHFIYL